MCINYPGSLLHEQRRRSRRPCHANPYALMGNKPRSSIIPSVSSPTHGHVRAISLKCETDSYERASDAFVQPPHRDSQHKSRDGSSFGMRPRMVVGHILAKLLTHLLKAAAAMAEATPSQTAGDGLSLCHPRSGLGSAAAQQSCPVQVKLEGSLLAVAVPNLPSRRRRDGRRVLAVTTLSVVGLLLPLASTMLLLVPDVGVAHALFQLLCRVLRRCRLVHVFSVGVVGVGHLLVLLRLFVQAAEARRHASRLGADLLPPLALLFLSVDGVTNVEHLAEVDSARRAEIKPPVAVHQPPGIEGAENTLGGDILPFLARSRAGYANPRMGEELLDRISLLRVNIQQMRDEVLGRLGNVIPPGG